MKVHEVIVFVSLFLHLFFRVHYSTVTHDTCILPHWYSKEIDQRKRDRSELIICCLEKKKEKKCHTAPVMLPQEELRVNLVCFISPPVFLFFYRYFLSLSLTYSDKSPPKWFRMVQITIYQWRTCINAIPKVRYYVNVYSIYPTEILSAKFYFSLLIAPSSRTTVDR